jgi:hypothetical protein
MIVEANLLTSKATSECSTTTPLSFNSSSTHTPSLPTAPTKATSFEDLAREEEAAATKAQASVAPRPPARLVYEVEVNVSPGPKMLGT